MLAAVLAALPRARHGAVRATGGGHVALDGRHNDPEIVKFGAATLRRRVEVHCGARGRGRPSVCPLRRALLRAWIGKLIRTEERVDPRALWCEETRVLVMMHPVELPDLVLEDLEGLHVADWRAGHVRDSLGNPLGQLVRLARVA